MSGRKININYTGADIKKYLEGKLSPAEMHAIEKAALNDPFLSDAIDGMTSLHNNKELHHFNSQVETLKRSVQHKKSNASILLKAAAVLVVIVTTIAIIFTRPQTVQHKEVVATLKVLPKEEETTATKQDTLLSIDAERTAPQEIKEKYSSTPKRAPSPVTIDSETEQLNSIARKEVADAANIDSPSIEKLADVISGRASGVNVASDNKNIDTSPALEEVVVSGYSGSKKRINKAESADLPGEIKPATGWKKFNTYIEKNKRTDTLHREIRGEVVVSFEVDTNGNASAFSIEKGLSDFYNDEALRLIKEGPKWKSTGPSSERIKISIEF